MDSTSDDGTPAEFDEAALYGVVREAVEDAILGVIGTLLLVGVALVIVLAGVGTMTRTGGPAVTVFGGLVTALVLYLGAVTLGVIPPVSERF
ncbi:hypothetical protein [Halorussus aquaticus]|uniref:Flagellin N-terminal-like domain-containing protein n=1 Tax=Halorussus aquaticus TaxID=2953748 RepID=A0ABD5PYR3_9EURY|nr:hypothetical protein [Halorussus aquaticus]